MGIVSDRRKREKKLRLRRRLGAVFVAAWIGLAAMSSGFRETLSGMFGETLRAAHVFGQSAQAELTLPERTVFARQLAVFDSQERAAAQVRRLNEQGIYCMAWQREKMRIVSSVALSREELLPEDESEQETYIIEDSMEEVQLKITAGAQELDSIRTLLLLPDQLLTQLLLPDGETLETILPKTRDAAQREMAAHGENALYAQLAQSLINWCALMEQTPSADRSYAAMTMYALCRELRLAAQNQPIAESTASAQRTPSTAAEVMPPA